MSYDDMEFRKFTYKSEFDKSIHTLEGILTGISLDRQINEVEVSELQIWLSAHSEFNHKQPFKELIPIISEAISDNYLDEEEKKNILWFCENYHADNKFYDSITHDIQVLHGILHGIISDNIISDGEVINLQKWLSDREHLSGCYPYDELNGLLLEILKDGIIDDNERKVLQKFFSEFALIFVDSKINVSLTDTYETPISISGICAADPNIYFSEKVFCFTGKSSRTKRSDLIDIVNSLGGVYVNSISKNTDYLIVGDGGNPAWAYSCYGRKVEEAMEIRKNGSKVIVAHENDFWDAVQDQN
ncbi:MAG: BRCT domain-containing protein [Leptospirales bacterium]